MCFNDRTGSRILRVSASVVDVRRTDLEIVSVIQKVLAAGGTEFEVEYKDGEEVIVAFNGPIGVGVANIQSKSAKARKLRDELYAAQRKPPRINCGGVEYVLRVKTFDSFGEEAFRGTLSKR